MNGSTGFHLFRSHSLVLAFSRSTSPLSFRRSSSSRIFLDHPKHTHTLARTAMHPSSIFLLPRAPQTSRSPAGFILVPFVSVVDRCHPSLTTAIEYTTLRCSFVSVSSLVLSLPCVLFCFSLHSAFHPLFHSTVHPLSRCFLLGPSDFSRAFNTEYRGALLFANRVTR